MRVLALDISTHTGWCLLEGEPGQTPTILGSGTVGLFSTINGYQGLPYPFDYVRVAGDLALQFKTLVQEHKPDIVVIEETNRTSSHGSRYTQKILEFTHCCTIQTLWSLGITPTYISTSVWRKTIGIEMTKADKKNNAKVAKARREGKSKTDLGVKGKITKKHLAVRWANNTFGLSLKIKDNDTAESLGLGTAWFLGAQACDGII